MRGYTAWTCKACTVHYWALCFMQHYVGIVKVYQCAISGDVTYKTRSETLGPRNEGCTLVARALHVLMTTLICMEPKRQCGALSMCQVM